MPYTAERVRSKHPFELLFLGMSFATAVSGIASHSVRPGSIEEGVGQTGTTGWYVLLLLGSLAALMGIFWPERATGLVLEEMGLLAAGLCTIFYAIVVVFIIGAGGGYAAGLLASYGTAAVCRSWQIRRFLATVAKEHPSNYQE